MLPRAFVQPPHDSRCFSSPTTKLAHVQNWRALRLQISSLLWRVRLHLPAEIIYCVHPSSIEFGKCQRIRTLYSKPLPAILFDGFSIEPKCQPFDLSLPSSKATQRDPFQTAVKIDLLAAQLLLIFVIMSCYHQLTRLRSHSLCAPQARIFRSQVLTRRGWDGRGISAVLLHQPQRYRMQTFIAGLTYRQARSQS